MRSKMLGLLVVLALLLGTFGTAFAQDNAHALLWGPVRRRLHVAKDPRLP